MKISKILCLLLSFVLIFGVTLSLASCNETASCTEHKDADGDGVCDTEGCNEPVAPTASEGTFNGNGELILFKDGTPTFKFVVGTDASIFTETLEELANTIKKYTKDKVAPAVEAAATSTVAEIEILVGTVDNRGEQYKINRYDYGNTGYAVKQVGTKLVVVGGSDNALSNAINYLKGTVFGIKKTNDPFTDLAMTKPYDVKQSNYSLKDITVDGVSLKNYVIAYPNANSTARNLATKLQATLYEKCGIRPDTMYEANANGLKKIIIRTLPNDGEGGGFYVTLDDEKNIVFECEFETKYEALVMEYFNTKIFSEKGTLALTAQKVNYAPDLRNITYESKGAVGDGIADDFFAIKAAHDEANKYLLKVHANPNATYRIGNANGTQSIIVKTDTYWNGCQFIFDDEDVLYTNKSARTTPIFKITPENGNYSPSKLPFTSLEAGATKIEGWEPGVNVLIKVENKNIKHYIRSGHNANSGKNQQEVLLVDAKGNIDPSTPVQWNYETVTKVTIAYIDSDRPIKIVGERFDDDGNVIGKTTVTTWHNNGPCAYWYYNRNIEITRSNVTISGVKHQFDKFVSPSNNGEGSPYTGFVEISFSYNVLVDNFTLHSPPAYRDSETDSSRRPEDSPNPTNGSMGTYELGAGHACNVTWKNCDQTDFFYESGKLHANGNMGTNYCRNLMFDNVMNCSFDAHSGLYNATIKNSTIEHLNFIGAGLIKYENVTVYAKKKYAVNLREDYGSTWNGDLEIDGLIMKTDAEDGTPNLAIIGGSWTNHNYGYTTYLPQNISIRNLVTAVYTYKMEGGVRIETITDYNVHQVSLFLSLNSPADDYSSDTVGKGTTNNNRMIATKKLDLYTVYTGKYAELGITKTIKITAPSGPFYKNFKYYIDGTLVEKDSN